ncbi:hypothetical protein BJV74DRAFT_830097 [Russula compacta]|nr:hypothetical protein BJV74DRAFT_830097 [Russula compacta]
MYHLECPICLNSFDFQNIRSLPCGHTYCSSCVEKLFKPPSAASACPECRDEFKFADVRRLFIKPSVSNSNDSSGSQVASSGHDRPAGFIKQAKHIARRLQKLNAESPAQSVKHAADVIEGIATIQCQEAQEIVWKAVREFWLRLATDFEQLGHCKEVQDKLSNFEQRNKVLDETCSRLLQEIETKRGQAQQYFNESEDKTREIDTLTTALRDADEKFEQEQESQNALIARLRALDIKHQFKSRETEDAANRLQLEEESLIVEPGVAYNQARSYRLDVYSESSPRRSKRLKSSPEPDGFDYPLSVGDLPTSSPDSRVQLREQTGQSHQPESDSLSPSPQRPKFGSDWNLSQRRPRRKLTAKSNSATLPFPLDSQGRQNGLLEYGPRVRTKTR